MRAQIFLVIIDILLLIVSVRVDHKLSLYSSKKKQVIRGGEGLNMFDKTKNN
nr:hypothetical protein [Pedobacter sp. ASV19]